MKTTILAKMAMGLCLICPLTTVAQFSSGSTGADGPLNVTSNTTLNLPPDGIFNFTTIAVASGTTLKFNRNPLNTPVYLLATSNVAIAGNIDVSASGQHGGPGGFDGGFGPFANFPAGDGQGPGGGTSGNHGVFAFGLPGNGNVYGNTLLSPLIGGSGGSANGNGYGGGGGGAILVCSSSHVTLTGRIMARGDCNVTYGSAGAIRIVAPVVDGNGVLDVLRCDGDGSWQNGRTRIDSLDRFAYRNIGMYGKATRGSQMTVFPANNPHLDIISTAGNAIPEGANSPVTVNLPVGSSTNQIVRVQARGFTNDVPIRVKITPENASSATFDGTILQSSGNPPFADVQVTLPVDTVCYIHAWTR